MLHLLPLWRPIRQFLPGRAERACGRNVAGIGSLPESEEDDVRHGNYYRRAKARYGGVVDRL